MLYGDCEAKMRTLEEYLFDYEGRCTIVQESCVSNCGSGYQNVEWRFTPFEHLASPRSDLFIGGQGVVRTGRDVVHRSSLTFYAKAFHGYSISVVQVRD